MKKLIKSLLPLSLWIWVKQLYRNPQVNALLYPLWIFQYDRLSKKKLKKMKAELSTFTLNPLVSIIATGHAAPVSKQIYPHYETITAPSDDAGLMQAKGEWIAFLTPGVQLRPHTLYQMIKALNQNPEAELIYSDSDEINANGRRFNPYFKPDWDPYLALSQDYLGPFVLAHKNTLKTPKHILHVPHILYHSDPHPHLIKKVELAFPAEAPKHPFISIIIPTKDRIDLLKPAVDSILAKAGYPHFEILIIDNNSTEASSFDYFRSVSNSQIRVLEDRRPFNFSALNNAAVQHAKGELLLFMNNDIEVITEGFLSKLLPPISQKDVGIVGTKLYYPNDTIQHAGGVLGIREVVAHIYMGAPRDADGYFGQLKSLHSTSFVTGACLMIKRNLFDAVGGFEETLLVNGSDVDLCLKATTAGYRILWTPDVELYHKESASLGQVAQNKERLVRFEQEAQFLKDRWGEVLLKDPYYNPNLTLHDDYYQLAFPPRSRL